MSNPAESSKALIRRRVRTQRAGLDAAEQQRAQEGLTVQLVSLLRQRGAALVSSYYPIPGEPSTLGFLDWALEAGVRVVLPAARTDGRIDWIEVTDLRLTPGLFGIPAPTGTPLMPEEVSRIDLMLIPACAVDRQGNRLGWGRGYFDRDLGSRDTRPPVYAVVHDREVLEEVPVEPHDVPVAGVVTPSRILEFPSR